MTTIHKILKMHKAFIYSVFIVYIYWSCNDVKAAIVSCPNVILTKNKCTVVAHVIKKLTWITLLLDRNIHIMSMSGQRTRKETRFCSSILKFQKFAGQNFSFMYIDLRIIQCHIYTGINSFRLGIVLMDSNGPMPLQIKETDLQTVQSSTWVCRGPLPVPGILSPSLLWTCTENPVPHKSKRKATWMHYYIRWLLLQWYLTLLSEDATKTLNR